MKTNAFDFYKVHHNEDADPFVRVDEKGGFLAVADGLGGSGSTVHKLDSKCYVKLEEKLRAAFLSDFVEADEKLGDAAGQFDQWIKKLLEPMIDEEPDTSALWASRVAIARFVYYFLSHPEAGFEEEKVRQEAVDYINEGLVNTRKKFDLRAGPIRGQLILPTTLVAMKYRLDEEDLIADVVWAGDSRAYALIPGVGLKQLSRDDEDASGSISNLFYVESDGTACKVELRHKRYRLPKDSAVFVCSDGFFDPFSPIDNVGVETVLLEAIANAKDFDELKRNWYATYEPMRHDDCSVAFAVNGYEKYEDFKSTFAPRLEVVKKLFDDFYRDKQFIAIFTGIEDDPIKYIRERAKKRKPEVVSAITAALFADRMIVDPVITDDAKEIFLLLADETEKSALRRREETEKRLAERIIDELRAGPARAAEILRNMPLQATGLEKEIGDIKNNAEYYLSAVRKAADLQQIQQDALSARDEAKQKGEGLCEQIGRRIEAIRSLSSRFARALEVIQQTEEAREQDDPGYSRKDNHAFLNMERGYKDLAEQQKRYLCTLNAILKMWEKKTEKIKCDVLLSLRDRDLFGEMRKAVRAYVAAEKELHRAEADAIDASKGPGRMKLQYDNKLSALQEEEVVETIRDPEKYYVDEFRSENGLPLPAPKATEVSKEELEQGLNTYYGDEAKYDKLIDALIAADTPSVIDGLFNAARMRACRQLGLISKEAVLQTKAAIDQAVAESEDVKAYSL